MKEERRGQDEKNKRRKIIVKIIFVSQKGLIFFLVFSCFLFNMP